MTTVQKNLVKAIEDRMEEIGLPRNFVFNQGFLTGCFVDLEMVLITKNGWKCGPLYSPTTKFSLVLSEFPELLITN